MALLYFVIPVGDSLVPRLQDITAVAATWLLTLTRVPAVLEGRLITVPGQQWQVAEACSGARYLLSSAILGLAFAFLAFRSWKRRILMIAASILVPVIANCLRAYGIIMIGYLSNNTLAHGIDHVIYGWVFFLVCMLLVFAIAARHMEPPAAPELLPLDQRKSSSSIAQLIAAAVACCIILLLPVAALNRLEAREVADSANLSAARTNDHWISTGLLVPRWISQALDTSTGDTEAFRPLAPGADRPVYVYSGSSRAAARVLGSGERLLNQNYWTVLGEADRTVEVNGHPFELHEMRTQGPGPHRLIWMWCLVNGVETNSPIALKLLQAKDGMLGRRAAVQIVAIAADYDFDAKEAAPSLLNFLNNATPALTGSAR
jgi:EpsI family protein